MKRSSERILTTHVGSLVRTPEIIEVRRKQQTGEPYDEARFERDLAAGVKQVVKQQADAGVDVPSDGEYGKSAWVGYIRERLGGVESLQVPPGQQIRSRHMYTDEESFAGFYPIYRSFEQTLWQPREPGKMAMPDPAPAVTWTNKGPVTYTGQAQVQRDIANFKAALQDVQVEEAFMPTVAPASAEGRPSEYYKTDEEYLFALADALHDEYKAVVDAGFVLQVDDAFIPAHYNPHDDLQTYLKWVEVRIDAVNQALRDIPEDRVRYHICWGSQNVPHTWDVPLKVIVDQVLRVNAQAYVIESANPRHEHEWQVWEDVRLPDGKILIPGMISHSTNVVEHPELISQRLQNFARLVGRENVIAGTDCGFSQNWNLIRMHPEVQWAKLEALAQGAALASKKLWS